ncbi:MAG: ATP synthase F1 subunit delta [Candidatus Glassbacteria bacterium]|nr:ATP synthase F1 subunit delta [Candidatus Glassbacteria bacterium]
MRTTTVSKEYARALFMLARREDKLDEVGAELAVFVELVRTHELVGRFLLAPQISTDAKLEVLRKALTGKLGPEVVKFVLVTCTKRRLDQLEAIGADYQELLNRHYNRLEVTATSARPLSDEEKQSLADRLAARLKRQVIIRASVDKSLVAGLVCRIGDVVYDGSLRRRIQLLSNQMLKAEI